METEGKYDVAIHAIVCGAGVGGKSTSKLVEKGKGENR
jgi:hypothetical protein